MKIAFFVGVLVIQALSAFLLIKGLKMPARWVPWIIVVFVIFNLPIPYLMWLQSGARQPPLWAAALIVRPVYAWQFNWVAFLLFIAPVIVGARLLVLATGWETVITVLRWAVIAFIGGWAVLAVYGLADTLRLPVAERVEVTLPGLPPEEDGLKVVLLTDDHVAWWNAKEEFRRIAAVAEEFGPDLLLITGDMVDHHPDYVYAYADCLKDLQPRLGRYAIIGNHDVYTGREAVARRMEERGFRMLRNEWTTLDDKGSRLVLAGLDDSGRGWTGGDPATQKLPEVMDGCPEERPTILMIHRPTRFEDFKGLPIDLVLAGHTHGGQLAFPFGGPGLAHLTFANPGGMYRSGDLSQYVSRGSGTVGWCYRLFCPKEVTFITLRSPEAD